MTRPVVLIAEELSPATVEVLGPDVEVRSVDGTDRPALLAAVAEADALLVRSATQVDAEVYAAAPKLRVVARAGVGLDNVDVPGATTAGVMVINAPTSNIVSAAELAIALILASLRNLGRADSSVKAGRWERKQLTGVEQGHDGHVPPPGGRQPRQDPVVAATALPEPGATPVDAQPGGEDDIGGQDGVEPERGAVRVARVAPVEVEVGEGDRHEDPHVPGGQRRDQVGRRRLDRGRLVRGDGGPRADPQPVEEVEDVGREAGSVGVEVAGGGDPSALLTALRSDESLVGGCGVRHGVPPRAGAPRQATGGPS